MNELPVIVLWRSDEAADASFGEVPDDDRPTDPNVVADAIERAAVDYVLFLYDRRIISFA